MRPLSGFTRKQWCIAMVSSAVVAAGVVVCGRTSAADSRSETIVVARSLKSDRLPVWLASEPAASKAGQSYQAAKRPPFGCDRAFSPVVDPDLAHIYGRCMA